MYVNSDFEFRIQCYFEWCTFNKLSQAYSLKFSLFAQNPASQYKLWVYSYLHIKYGIENTPFETSIKFLAQTTQESGSVLHVRPTGHDTQASARLV